MSELQSINIMNLLDKNLNNDPNSNYDILHNILTTTINKHIPLNKVKFNKYRHKKTNWITYGILRSIRFRNNLYRKMIQTKNPTDYAKIKHNLSVYNKILKYTIREAKLSFHNRKLFENRHDPKKHGIQLMKPLTEIILKHFQIIW